MYQIRACPPKPGTGTSTGNRQGVIPAGEPNAGAPNGVDVEPELLEEVVIRRENNSNVTIDGIKVWGVGGDPFAGSGGMEGDRGSGSMDMPGHDYNSLFDFGKLLGGGVMPAVALFNFASASLFGSNENFEAPTTETKTVETVTMHRFDYKPTDAFGSTLSTPHAGYPRDTIVIKGNESIVNKLNTRDSIKAAKESRVKNANHRKKYAP